ncbi:MAG: hypothetical protein GVY30_00830 [Chloroflexi bacterium]|jgi:hypothetical protein|nr:hypothetical protein [Chloroflexota bacterium]
MTKTLRLTFVHICLWLALLLACAAPPSQLTLQSAQPASKTIRIVDLNHTSIKAQMFEISGTEDNWRTMLNYLSQRDGAVAWVTITHIESLDLYEEPYSTNPNRIPSRRPTHARTLIRNGYAKSHSLRIIFLLDCQQISVSVDDQDEKPYYDLPVLQPDEEFALEYIIPPLSSGLHHFSLLLIADPESVNDELSYRFSQQLSFGEQRYSLWVGVQNLDQADTLLGTIAPPTDPIHYGDGLQVPQILDSKEDRTPIYHLQIKADTVQTMDLHLATSQLDENHDPAPGQTFPVIIGIFWNDEMRQMIEYDFPVPLAGREEHTVTLPIRTPKRPGKYQLMAVVFGAPHSRVYDNEGHRSLYPKTEFTQRVRVEVTP